ncbi:MAG TPA: SGNH/GDSL hydrolase family protein, partial [Geobacteraceae bacterium]|nr:SGNH/GDSL hydrolase family protein [Geobacteraceae bacterium]
PDAPYARGFPHFSNGKTWVEQLAKTLGLGVSTGPALKNPRVFSNYAVGGARARGTESSDLNNQVKLFLDHFHHKAPADALYVVYAGNNDLRDALSVLADDPTPPTVSTAILTRTLAAIGKTITELAGAGAHTFLVANAPPLDLVPAILSQDKTVQDAAKSLSTEFNNGLEMILSTLEAKLAVKIIRLDVYTLFNQVVTDPAAAGLAEVKKPCITPGTIDHPFCEQPDEYLFWDAIHPTVRGHALLAEEAQQALVSAQR